MHLTLENNTMKFSYCASFQQKLQSLSLLVEVPRPSASVEPLFWDSEWLATLK